jgi:signal transduction histidine kinase/CheY-like chemotaxis protein/HPt (histidine-containing phosphotransfer) domain-containing protein
MTRQDIVKAAGLRHLLDLFSVVMVVDRDLQLVFASDTLLKHMPDIADQPTLFDVFDVARPGSVTSFDEIEGNKGSLFLLVARDKRFAIRGQVIDGSGDDGDFLVFCGAPWLLWMNSHQPAVKLGLKDFSPQDVQIDQLFYMTTEARMVEDLERLNAELREAKHKVEDAQEARNTFFAQMSHEMRTPLNGLVSALSLMGEHSLQGQVAELHNLASKSSENLLHVIDYVLEVSRLEATDVDTQSIEFDLPGLIESVVDVVRARAMEKNLALHSHIDADVVSTYRGDAPRLRQVLLNLLINAVKFTERGAVSLSVGASGSEDQTLRIEVADTGVGIAKEAQLRIFEPFVTVDTWQVNATGKGTGLGLDIARRNVDAMGGRIGVASSLGVGSTFWIELPLEPVEHPIETAAEQKAVQVKPETFSGRVLLVDDNETNLMLGTMILESMGITVLQAENGERAVELALGENPDLVLMDISMPGMDGYEATECIRQQKDPAALPVIALTAYASSVERERSEQCGMNNYLTKPIERDRLSSVLSEWLGAAGRGRATSRDSAAREELVDRAVVESMLGQIGANNLTTVIDKFTHEAGQRWSALANAASSEDLAREAHTLASTCMSFGLPGVAEHLREIEAAAKTGVTVDQVARLSETGIDLQTGLQSLQSVVHDLRA